MEGQQTIKCDVESCRHYTNNHCSLGAIQVAPCANMNSGLPEDESMCSSYEPRS